MNACTTVLELLGIMLSIVAWICSLVTTLMPHWQSKSSEFLLSESYENGLWETCVMHEESHMECQPYETLLGLPSDIKLAQIFMCLALATGILGILLAIPGLHVIKSCKGPDGWKAKKIMKIMGAIFELLTGVQVLIPVSYIAHMTVQEYFDKSLSEHVVRWEFGDSLFCGWTAGFLHLVAGVLLLCSCCWLPLEPASATPQIHGMRGVIYSHKSATEYV